MAVPQDGLVSITDSVFPRTFSVSPADAVNLVGRYPSRFTINGPDPRAGVATIGKFFGLSEYTPSPIITGSRGGNAALASLLQALTQLGLVQDQTTA
jgi:hypothetical protein